jgi:voltage-gated potassium channel
MGSLSPITQLTQQELHVGSLISSFTRTRSVGVMLKKLRSVVEESDSRLGLLFNLSVQFTIVVSLVVVSIETLPGLDERYLELLQNIELIVVCLFTLEYFLRLLVAPKKMEFVFSFWGMIDLLAILPYYLLFFGFGFELIMLRAFRLLRIVRILKLARYSKSIARLGMALSIAKEDLILALGGASIMLFVASFGIYQFENMAQPDKFSSVFDSLWWALATLTTVGYGDIYPITFGGKVFTGVILMIGLGVVALPAAIITSALTEARKVLGEN